MQGAAGIFHIAGWYKTGEPKAEAIATAIDVEGTRHVLGVMREMQIMRAASGVARPSCRSTPKIASTEK